MQNFFIYIMFIFWTKFSDIVQSISSFLYLLCLDWIEKLCIYFLYANMFLMEWTEGLHKSILLSLKLNKFIHSFYIHFSTFPVSL